MLGDLTLPNVTVDISDVKSDSVTVKAKVHWRKIPRVCDAHMEERIKLR